MNELIWRIQRKILVALTGEERVATGIMVHRARQAGVRVGEGCRLYSLNFSTEPYLVRLGNHVTVTYNVQFVTHDGATWVFRERVPELELFGPIVVGDNVFIGLNSIILFNTVIGDNSIVAAGSVVKGVFEPNSVIAGVPARRISTIEGYFEKNRRGFVNSKGKGPAEKRRLIQNHFHGDRHPGD